MIRSDGKIVAVVMNEQTNKQAIWIDAKGYEMKVIACFVCRIQNSECVRTNLFK
jgi:hypothetical protein